MREIEVVAGVIKNINDEFFCAQRADIGELGLKWEFPGGKIELGETHKEALSRELSEELNIEAVIGEHIITVEHTYTTFHLTMHTYYIESYMGSIELKEHIDSKWLKSRDLKGLKWAEADLPIIKVLRLRRVLSNRIK